jgi:hypothetical protein
MQTAFRQGYAKVLQSLLLKVGGKSARMNALGSFLGGVVPVGS